MKLHTLLDNIVHQLDRSAALIVHKAIWLGPELTVTQMCGETFHSWLKTSCLKMSKPIYLIHYDQKWELKKDSFHHRNVVFDARSNVILHVKATAWRLSRFKRTVFTATCAVWSMINRMCRTINSNHRPGHGNAFNPSRCPTLRVNLWVS